MKLKGFTLVELITVIAIMGILIALILFVLNPVTQKKKVIDAARKHDIQQVKTAVDLYYNDHNCYPSTIEFGSPWVEGSVLYMAKVPDDTTCDGGSCYAYLTDGSCPQWGVLFAKLSTTQAMQTSQTQCSLTKLSGCTPEGYDASSWSCIVRGNISTSACSYIAQQSLIRKSIGPGQFNVNSTSLDGQPCSLDWVCSSGVCNQESPGMGSYCTQTQCSANCKP